MYLNWKNLKSSDKKGGLVKRVILTTLVVFLGTLLFVSSVEAAWYNPSYAKRKSHVITGSSGAGTNYQVKIIAYKGTGTDTAGTVYLGTGIQDDFDDVRFTDNDEITPLDFWIASTTPGVSAEFWVEVADTLDSNATIYVYYQNPSATSASNGNNTFLFFDDFSGDLSDWTIDAENTDKITIVGGALRHDPDSTQTKNIYFDTRAYVTSLSISDFALHYRTYLGGGTNRKIHQFGWRTDGLTFNSGYAWRNQNSASDGGFFEFASGAWTPIGTQYGPVSSDAWHTVQVNAVGSNMETIYNGSSIRTVSDATTASGSLTTHVHGVSLGVNDYVLVDDVFVRKLVATEPSHSTWGSEESNTITISGTVYSDEGVTPLSGTQTVRVRVNGAGEYTGTLSSGVYSIPNVVINAAGDVITVFLDGATEKAVTVTRVANNSSNITGLNLYQNHVVVRSEDGNPITNANLDQHDSGQDADIQFMVTTGALTVSAGNTLYVLSGTYTPGGNITTPTFKQVGGTFNGGSGMITINGAYTLSGGTFNSTSGVMVMYGNWTHTAGGTFNHNNGTVNFGNGQFGSQGVDPWVIDVDTSETFNNLIISVDKYLAAGGTVEIASGDTLIVLGNFALNQGVLNGGVVEVRGNMSIGFGWNNAVAAGGTSTISFLADGDQTITSTGPAPGGRLPNLNINKATGTVSASGNFGLANLTLSSGGFTSTSETLAVFGNWTNAGGVFNHNNGTVDFGGNLFDGSLNNPTVIDVDSTENFNNLTFTPNKYLQTVSIVVSSGDTLVVLGTLSHLGGPLNTGTLEARGNVLFGGGAWGSASGGNATLNFMGTSNQTITHTSGTLPTGTFTINKSSGTVTLASDLILGTYQAFNITSGTFSQGASYNFRAGAVTVGASGVWSNLGTGNITLGGNVSNSGTITLNSNNSTQCVDGANDIAITSSVGGTQRTWSGAGTYTLRNVAVTDMLGALTAYTSTFTNSNWTNGDCGITISGTLYAGDEITPVTTGTVKLSVAGGTATTTPVDGSGNWSFINLTAPTAGQVVTVWVDAGSTTGTNNASLIFKYGAVCEGGTANCTGLSLYQTNTIIGVDYNNTANTITNADLATCDNDSGTGCTDTDIGFTSNAGTLTSTWTTNTLRIKDANAKFAPGGNLTIGGFNQSAGAFDASGATAWYNPSYAKRKSHVITGSSGAGTNYQVKIIAYKGTGTDTAGTVYLGTGIQDDFDDVRFTDNDGITPLDFWIASTTSGVSAEFWVEVQDTLESDATIYMYYQNASATTGSNGNNTFLFFDDFSGASLDLDKWTAFNVNSTSQSGGILSINNTNKDPSKVIADVNGTGQTGSNVAMRARYRITGGSHSDQRIGLSVKTDVANGQSYNYVMHDFANKDERQFLDDSIAWGTSNAEPFASNTWYIEEIYHNGTAVVARYDDGTWYSWTRSGRSGYLALNPGGYSDVVSSDWDYAFIRKIVSTEPVHSTWGEEEVSSISINLYGSLVISGGVFVSTESNLNFVGDSAQTITNSGGTVTLGPVVINKTNNSDTVTLGSHLALNDTLTITKGLFSQGSSYNLTTGGVLTISANGTLRNRGTGDLTLGGEVTNAGTIIMNSNNGTQCVDGANDIAIVSSSNGVQRTWSGAGTFTIYNADVTDMLDDTITITTYNSSLTNSDWTVGEGCYVVSHGGGGAVSVESSSGGGTVQTGGDLGGALSGQLQAGPNNPGTVGEDTSVGYRSWTNASNVLANDNLTAFLSGGDPSQGYYMKITNFGFNIPVDATVNGIKVEAEIYSTREDDRDASIRLVKNNTITGNDKANVTNYPLTANTYKSYGGNSDLWGTSLTPNDVNSSNFGFVMSVFAQAGITQPMTVYVDHVRVTVYYTPYSGGGGVVQTGGGSGGGGEAAP